MDTSMCSTSSPITSISASTKTSPAVYVRILGAVSFLAYVVGSSATDEEELLELPLSGAWEDNILSSSGGRL